MRAHANFVAQQVKSEGDAELHSFQEQARVQIASLTHHKDEEFERLRQAAQGREAELLAELQQHRLRSEGQASGYAVQQEEDNKQHSLHTEILQEKEAHVQGLQTRLE